ncbi:hypothetical protein SteCoe_21544 [Stentor coeruleus]|uniref:Myb-like domain-containing protein n=1 Tax=Stentor coeruleus TaxID=5963 RepID=A0A1R2BP48_9CILI|nr:hypothetical protein SteCoe_21544 [Stentor coeruleus]
MLYKRKPKLWKPFEDSILTDLVREYSERKWKTVARKITKNFNISRTSKQCRERWYNYLRQKNYQPFTKIEIKTILEAQKVYKNKWSKIAKLLLGRTENQVKNFMNSTVRRNIRKFNKGKSDEEKISISTLDLLLNQEIREILTAKKEINRSVLMKVYLSSEAKEFIHSLASPSYKIKGKNSKNLKIIIENQNKDTQDWDLKEFQDIVNVADNFNNDRRTPCLLPHEDFYYFIENRDCDYSFSNEKSLESTLNLKIEES